VNFIRAKVAEGSSPLEALIDGKATADKPWEQDQYMHPVLPEDPLLFYDFDDSMLEEQDRYSVLAVPFVYHTSRIQWYDQNKCVQWCWSKLIKRCSTQPQLSCSTAEFTR